MLLNRNFYFFLVFLSFVLYACNQQDKIEIEKSASAFDIKQGEASVLQSNQHFMKAFKARDSVEVGNCFTMNAKAMATNQAPVNGRADIIVFFANIMKGGVDAFDVKTVKIWGDSSILAEEGTYKLSDKDGNQIDKGEYIVLWKQESGNWKRYRDIWTSSMPVSAIKVEARNMPMH
jgi:ketosteroid isomerase-like protein